MNTTTPDTTLIIKAWSDHPKKGTPLSWEVSGASEVTPDLDGWNSYQVTLRMRDHTGRLYKMDTADAPQGTKIKIIAGNAAAQIACILELVTELNRTKQRTYPEATVRGTLGWIRLRKHLNDLKSLPTPEKV
jgi:hypothetical protein